MDPNRSIGRNMNLSMASGKSGGTRPHVTDQEVDIVTDYDDSINDISDFDIEQNINLLSQIYDITQDVIKSNNS